MNSGFDLDMDTFLPIATWINNPSDYFDFPSSLIAFGESLKNSNLIIRNRAYFRHRGKNLTLITFFCLPAELRQTIASFKKEGYKIKSLNFANKDLSGFETIKYDDEYWVDHAYSFERSLQSKSSKSWQTLKRKMKKAGEQYFIGNPPTHQEVLAVFDLWKKEAELRHFMVVKGHYLAYIERFFRKPNNVRLIAFRKRINGRLHGIAGYEVHKGKAQITLMKHIIGDNTFPAFFWIRTIETILKQHKVTKIFCGSTADQLKKNLCFNSQKSFKIKL